MITQVERTSSQLGHDVERQLEAELADFDLWAATVEHGEDGWEGCFPGWQKLAQASERMMALEIQGKDAQALLGRAWAITEEDENCADWAREHLQEAHVRDLVRRLAYNPEPKTRWQACDVLGALSPLDAATLKVLEDGTEDEDAYVRRRAFLALMGHGEVDPQPYVRQMLSDVDSYNRYVAVGRYDPRLTPEALQDRINAVKQDPEVARLVAAAE